MSVRSTGSWIVSVMVAMGTVANAQPAPGAPPIPKGDDDTPPARVAAPGTPVASPTPTGAYGPPQVEPPVRPVTLILRTNADFGGDDLLTITTTEGDSATLAAGTGLTLAAGLIIQPDIPFALELTAGYKFRTISASNGSATFSRIPLDAIASFAPGHHRLGVGITAHASPSVDCNFSGVCDATVKFDTAVGLILQWAYTYEHVDFGARATFITYSVTGANGPISVSGDSFGIFTGLRL